MDQQLMQYTSKTHYQMFQLPATVHNLCPQPESSPIKSIILINDCLRMLSQLSFRRRLNSSTSHTEFFTDSLL